MWLLELPQPGMLFRGLLYFMRSVSARCLLTNHVRSSLWGTPCLLANDSHPQVSYPPKLAIKTNLACGEIKPSLAEEWHQLQVSHCAFCTLLSITPPLSFTLSLPPFLSATNSNSPTFLWVSPWPPTCPSLQMNVRLPKKGASTIWLLCPLDIHMYGCMIPTRKFNSPAFNVVSKSIPVFRFPSLTESYLLTRLWVNHTVEPLSIARNTSSPSGIIWESINLQKEWTVIWF